MCLFFHFNFGHFTEFPPFMGRGKVDVWGCSQIHTHSHTETKHTHSHTNTHTNTHRNTHTWTHTETDI